MLTAYPVPGKDKSRGLCEAFVRGAPKGAEGAVFAGVKDGNVSAWDVARKLGRTWFYIDNSYFDATRGKRFRVTKNRLQVAPRAWKSDGSRFEVLGLTVESMRWPLSAQYGHALLVEQSELHMRLLATRPDWLNETAATLRERGIETRLRPWNRNKREAQQNLRQALAAASSCVTHSSAAAVEATLMGLPCIVSEQHALSGMFLTTTRDERRHFLNVLADHEFTLEELEDGTAWCQVNA